MKTTTAVGLTLSFCALTTTGQPLGIVAADSTRALATNGAPGTMSYLNSRIPEVAFVDLPFDQVVDWLAQFTGISIVVRWQPLIDAGVSREKPITLNVKNLRVSQILWMIMNEAGGTDLKLAYRASGDLLVLSTAADLGNEVVVRVYDISDLLVRVRNFAGPQVNVADQQGGAGAAQAVLEDMGTGDEGGEATQQPAAGVMNPDVRYLVDVIRQVVEPDSWLELGGRGTITAFRQQLIVRNTILVHQMLGGYVAD